MFKIVWLRDGGRPHDIGANADSTRRNLRFSREWPRRIERASGFANRAVAHQERDSLARCRMPRRPWRAESIAAGPGGGARLPRGGHGEDGPLALHIAKEAAEREVETKVRQQVTPAQCRAARALIGISQAEFARAGVVPRNVVIDFEVSSLKPRPPYLEAIERTPESAGVEFIDVGDRPGARPRRGASSSV
jgi:DNA-binding transcriptional regulator YiaG